MKLHHWRRCFRSGRSIAAALLFAITLAGTAEAARYGTPTVTLIETGWSVTAFRVQAAPDGAVGGFRVQWMKKSDFDAQGGWPAVEDYNNGLVFCQFNDVPTLNTAENTTTYQLGPNATARIEVGDVFDETGMYANYDGELQPGTQYILRVRAEGYGPILPSFWTGNVIYSTSTLNSNNCTFTQGYWKTHPNNWPVNSLTIGTVTYTKDQLLAIYNTPARGNGLISLAHQLITTMLNMSQGASIPGAQLSAYNASQLMIGGLVIPSIGSGYLAPGSTSSYTQTLDNYNNGITGPGHCGTPLPVEASTWSRVKGLLTH